MELDAPISTLNVFYGRPRRHDHMLRNSWRILISECVTGFKENPLVYHNTRVVYIYADDIQYTKYMCTNNGYKQPFIILYQFNSPILLGYTLLTVAFLFLSSPLCYMLRFVSLPNKGIYSIVWTDDDKLLQESNLTNWTAWQQRSGVPRGRHGATSPGRHLQRGGVGGATDSRQLLDSRVHSSLVVTYSRVRHTRVGRTYSIARPTRTLEYILP